MVGTPCGAAQETTLAAEANPRGSRLRALPRRPRTRSRAGGQTRAAQAEVLLPGVRRNVAPRLRGSVGHSKPRKPLASAATYTHGRLARALIRSRRHVESSLVRKHGAPS